MAETSKKGKAKNKAKAAAKARPKGKAEAKAKGTANAKPKAPAKAKKVKKPKVGRKPKATSKPKAASKPPRNPEPGSTEPDDLKPSPEDASKADRVSEGAAEGAATATEDTPVGAGVNAALAGKAALAGTRAAGHAVGAVVSKAKGPIVVGGGLIAGAAGGLALVRRRNGSASTGPLDVERVIAAARRAGSFGEELGRMASLMEQASSNSKNKRK